MHTKFAPVRPLKKIRSKPGHTAHFLSDCSISPESIESSACNTAMLLAPCETRQNQVMSNAKREERAVASFKPDIVAPCNIIGQCVQS